MGVVVLDAHQRQAVGGGHLFGDVGGGVIRMQVTGDLIGGGVVQRLEVVQRLPEDFDGPGAVHIAEMLADEDMIVMQQRDGVLLVAAHRQNGAPLRIGDSDRLRDVSACAAQHQQFVRRYTDDRVVHVTGDRAVVDQKQIGDPVKAGQRVMLVGADRLAGQIAAGGDHRKAEIAEQQVMQRRVGQHRAEIWITRCDVGRDVGCDLTDLVTAIA